MKLSWNAIATLGSIDRRPGRCKWGAAYPRGTAKLFIRLKRTRERFATKNAASPRDFQGMAPMSNGGQENGPPGCCHGGLTRRWRIGDLNIPHRVASQQSPTPFFQAIPQYHNGRPQNSVHWTSEPCLENPGGRGAEPPGTLQSDEPAKLFVVPASAGRAGASSA